MVRRKPYKGHCMLCARAKGTFKGNHKDAVPARVQRQLGRARRFNKDVS